MNKEDYIWLTRNTDIINVCEQAEKLVAQSTVFKIFRKSHLPKIKEIFANRKVLQYIDKQDNCYLKVKNMTVGDFCEIALQYGSDLLHKDGKAFYIPVNQKKDAYIFWRKTPQQLSELSPQKKLDILYALDTDCYMSEEEHLTALKNQADKMNVLLDLPIPPKFWEREQRKIRLIAAEIARIPNIKEKLENFAELNLIARKELLKDTIDITAHYNGIKSPRLFILTQKQMQQYIGDDFQCADTDALNIDKSIYIRRGEAKKQSGARCLSLVWHETNHVAMTSGNYSQFPLMEDIMNTRLSYVGDIGESYIFSPQEKINYALEKQFIEECVARTGIKKLGNTFAPSDEIDVATQYISRSLQKKY